MTDHAASASKLEPGVSQLRCIACAAVGESGAKSVRCAQCGDLLEVSRTKSGEKRIPQLMPAGKNDSVSLMSEELMRGGLHDVYLHAVNCIRESL